MYFDENYFQRPLPFEVSRNATPIGKLEESITSEVSIHTDDLNFSEHELAYIRALTALDISEHFIRVSLGSGGRRGLETAIQEIATQLKTGPVQNETPLALAESLKRTLGDNLNEDLIERGIRFDLTQVLKRGNKKLLSKWKKEKDAYEEWKRDTAEGKLANGESIDLDDQGERIPPKRLHGAYKRHVDHVKPRLDMVGYMSKNLESWWNTN